MNNNLVGEVVSTRVPTAGTNPSSAIGYGFTLKRIKGGSMSFVSFIYETEADAQEARRAMLAIVDKAVSIS